MLFSYINVFISMDVNYSTKCFCITFYETHLCIVMDPCLVLFIVYKVSHEHAHSRISIFFTLNNKFFFPKMKLLSHQLGRIITKRMYKKGYTHIGESPYAQDQENETTYIAFRTDLLKCKQIPIVTKMVPFSVGLYEPPLGDYTEGRVVGESETTNVGAGSSISAHFLLVPPQACSALILLICTNIMCRSI